MPMTVSRSAADGKEQILKDKPKISVRSQWGNFCIVPIALLESDLSQAARLVWISLMSRVDHDDEEARAYPGYDAIMTRCGITGRATISRALEELERKQWLHRTKRFSGSTVYTLLKPDARASSSNSERMDDAPVVQNLNDSSSKSERQKFKNGTLTRSRQQEPEEPESVLARASRGAASDESSAPSFTQQPQTAEAPAPDHSGDVNKKVDATATAPILEQPRVDSTLADEPVVPKTKTKAASKETPAHPHTPYGDCFVGVAKACAMDPKVPMLAKRISVAAKYLTQRSVDPACIERFGQWWTASDWRGQRGDLPTPERIVELWLQFERAPAARPVVRPAATVTNGRTFRRGQSAFTDADRARAEAEALAELNAEGAR